MIKLYDTFKKAVIETTRENCLKELGFDKWRLDGLIKGKNKILFHRYVTPENLHLVKTIVNQRTKEEYECISTLGFLRQIGLGDGSPLEKDRVNRIMNERVCETRIRSDTFKNKNGKILEGHKFEGREGITLYDVFEEKTIEIKCGKISEACEKLGFDYTLVYKLGTKSKNIGDRFILPEMKSEIFTLIDINTGQEFNCITNASLFVQLGQPQNDNYSKYIYAMKLGRQKTANIYGRTFELREPTLSTRNRVSPNYDKEEYAKQRFQLKTSHRIRTALRNRVRSALLYRGKKKLAHTFDLTGCSIAFLIGYIEAKFQSGMNWENYGLWEIDHIKPVASFPLDTEESQRECCHYSNLQPLWAEENGSKNDKSPEEWEKYKAEKLKRQEAIQKAASFSYTLTS